MDVYTCSFTHPRVPATSRLPSSLDFPSPYALQPPGFGDPQMVADVEAVQKLVMTASQLHGCLVSFTKAGQGRGWNFYLSGSYQQVMGARGMVLRECPGQVSSLVLFEGVV